MGERVWTGLHQGAPCLCGKDMYGCEYIFKSFTPNNIHMESALRQKGVGSERRGYKFGIVVPFVLLLNVNF